MERLTRKLKKGGYSANRHPAAQIDERLSQLKGVHKQWVGDVSDMITGMKQSEAAGQEGALTLMMLQAGYAAIVRIGRRFESACPPVEGSSDDTATALGKKNPAGGNSRPIRQKIGQAARIGRERQRRAQAGGWTGRRPGRDQGPQCRARPGRGPGR